MDFNKAIVSGRLTADPEGRALESGTPLTTFSIASNRAWTKDGQKQEEAEFHNVVVFGKQGEACASYLRKGMTALVEGRLKTRSWDHEGSKHYRTEIVAERVIFGPRSISADESELQGRAAPTPAPARTAAQPTMPAYPNEEINPEDIPF